MVLAVGHACGQLVMCNIHWSSACPLLTADVRAVRAGAGQETGGCCTSQLHHWHTHLSSAAVAQITYCSHHHCFTWARPMAATQRSAGCRCGGALPHQPHWPGPRCPGHLCAPPPRLLTHLMEPNPWCPGHHCLHLHLQQRQQPLPLSYWQRLPSAVLQLQLVCQKAAQSRHLLCLGVLPGQGRLPCPSHPHPCQLHCRGLQHPNSQHPPPAVDGRLRPRLLLLVFCPWCCC